jgi:hypothetical protein
MALRTGIDDALTGTCQADDVIEIALLLPAKRMDALMDLSKSRGQSVGQILRGLIERELHIPLFENSSRPDA